MNKKAKKIFPYFIIGSVVFILIFAASFFRVFTYGNAPKGTIYCSSCSGIYAVNPRTGRRKLIVSSGKIKSAMGENAGSVQMFVKDIFENSGRLFFIADIKKTDKKKNEISEAGLFSAGEGGGDAKLLTPCEGVEHIKRYASSDKKEMVFSFRFDGFCAIYALGDSGSGANLFCVGPEDFYRKNIAEVTGVAFVPNSNSILFSAVGKSSGKYALYRADISGNSAPKEIVSGKRAMRFLNWSPDGKKFALRMGNTLMEHGFVKERIYIINRDGYTVKPVTGEHFIVPGNVEWSDDSSLLAFCYLKEPEGKCPPLPDNEVLEIVSTEGKLMKDIGPYDYIDGIRIWPGEKIVFLMDEMADFITGKGRSAFYETGEHFAKVSRITPFYDYVFSLNLRFVSERKKENLIFVSGTYPYGNHINLLDVKNGTVKTVFSFCKRCNVLNIVFSPDRSKYFVNVQKNARDDAEKYEIFVFDSKSGNCIGEFDNTGEFRHVKWIGNSYIGLVNTKNIPCCKQGKAEFFLINTENKLKATKIMDYCVSDFSGKWLFEWKSDKEDR